MGRKSIHRTKFAGTLSPLSFLSRWSWASPGICCDSIRKFAQRSISWILLRLEICSRDITCGDAQEIKQGPERPSGTVITVELSPFAPFPSAHDVLKQSKTKEVRLQVEYKDQSLGFAP